MNSLIDQEQGLALDPFAFHGHPASCIAGLGGAGALPDPTYAFHTPYVPVSRGHSHFRLRFTGLQARRGSLWLRIHMLPGTPGAVARMVTSHRLQLNWLAAHGSEAELRFEAFRGATYALMGLVPDDTDAAATGLSITLDRPATPEDVAADIEAEETPEAHRTAYGTSQVKPSAMLVSLDPPLFAHPVSQPATDAQLREPAFRDRAGQRPARGAGLEDWPAAYILQVLDRYGALRPGARGLALGAGAAALATVVAAAGATCRTAGLFTEGAPDGIDPLGLPGELFGFDFVFSLRATDALGGNAAARRFLEGAMECLRPGGLAVHVVSLGAGAAQFDRGGLERAALGLISRGHEVARLKAAAGRPADGFDTAVPFGLVARRAGSIL